MSSEVISDARNQWRNAIVVYVVGPKPYYPYFKEYILRVWKPMGEFSIFSMENGFYVIKFSKEKDCLNVLEGGPYYYNKKLMMMKRWNPGMQLNKDLLKTIPIWIRLPNLPLDFWTEEGISRIASVLGTPIRLDKFTEGIIKIAFARVLIEIDSNFTFPIKIPILNDKDEIIWQAVNYEWKPSICPNCRSFGHAEIHCQFTKVWLPKENCTTVNKDTEMAIDSYENENVLKNSDDNTKLSNQVETMDTTRQHGQKTHAEPTHNFHINASTNVTTTDHNQESLEYIQVDQTTDECMNTSKLTYNNDTDRASSLNMLTQSSSRILHQESCSIAVPIQNKENTITDSTISAIQQETETMESSHIIRNKPSRKTRSEEVPFEFKASLNSEVVENPEWSNLVSQLKNKNKKSKKTKNLGKATPMEDSSEPNINC